MEEREAGHGADRDGWTSLVTEWTEMALAPRPTPGPAPGHHGGSLVQALLWRL